MSQFEMHLKVKIQAKRPDIRLKMTRISILFLLMGSMVLGSEAWGRAGRNPGNTGTEAGFCLFCGRSGVGEIDLGSAGSSGGRGLAAATKAFKAAASKYSKDCLNKPYILITDLSAGTDNNMTYILRRGANGEYSKVDQFQTGQGKGVSNQSGSNKSPSGLLRLNGFGMYDGRRENGAWYTWPIFRDTRGNKFNYIQTSGLEPKNRNASARGVAFHPITYSTGETTKGCTGIPKDKFYLWSESLRDSCAYNYDGTQP